MVRNWRKREQYSRRAVQEAGWLSYIAAKAEYRQENMTPGSADFLLKFCIAENNELERFSEIATKEQIR